MKLEEGTRNQPGDKRQGRDEGQNSFLIKILESRTFVLREKTGEIKKEVLKGPRLFY